MLTSWDDGHLVRYRAERPTIQDNFGVFADRRASELAGAYFDAREEEAAYRAAQRLGARYVIATVAGSGQRKQPHLLSVGQRAWRFLGSSAVISQGPYLPGRRAAALARHRLIWLGDGAGDRPAVGAPQGNRVAVFEIVPGAWVEGQAEEDMAVVFELPLASAAGSFTYQARTRATADGRYEIRLPYPTDARFSPLWAAAGAYAVRSGGQSDELQVRESDVQAGARVSGPRFPRRSSPR